MTRSLDLEFRRPAKNVLPGPSCAYIYVKTYTTEKDTNGKNQIFITPDCVTLKELDEQINQLIKELEEIRKKAIRLFSKKEHK